MTRSKCLPFPGSLIYGRIFPCDYLLACQALCSIPPNTILSSSNATQVLLVSPVNISQFFSEYAMFSWRTHFPSWVTKKPYFTYWSGGMRWGEGEETYCIRMTDFTPGRGIDGWTVQSASSETWGWARESPWVTRTIHTPPDVLASLLRPQGPFFLFLFDYKSNGSWLKIIWTILLKVKNKNKSSIIILH